MRRYALSVRQITFIVVVLATVFGLNHAYRVHPVAFPSTDSNPVMPFNPRRLGFDQTRLLAGRLAAEIDRGTCACYAKDADLTYNGAFVVLAFEQILGRSPSVDERTEYETYLDEQTERLKTGLSPRTIATGSARSVAASTEPAQRAREDLVDLLCNGNDYGHIR